MNNQYHNIIMIILYYIFIQNCCFNEILKIKSAIIIQSLFRGFKIRKNKKKSIKKDEYIPYKIKKSALIIQRVYRGYIGRKKANDLRKQRIIKGPIKNAAVKYLEHGRLWSFLGEVQGDYDKVQEELDEEKRLAKTFIKEVCIEKEKSRIKLLKEWKKINKKQKDVKHSDSTDLIHIAYSNIRPQTYQLDNIPIITQKSQNTVKNYSPILLKKKIKKEQLTIVQKRQSKPELSKTSNDIWKINNKHDPIQKLVFQAVLKEYIPSFSQALTTEDAYKEYLSLSNGSLKNKWDNKVKLISETYYIPLYKDGIKDVESVFNTNLDKYDIPYFLMKRIKDIAEKVMLADKNSSYIKVSRDYKKGKNDYNIKPNESSDDEYNLLYKYNETSDNLVNDGKPFGYPLDENDPSIDEVENDKKSKEKAIKWRNRKNKNIIPLYEEDINSLNISVSRMDEIKQLSALKRQLLDNIEIRNGNSPIDVLCMYAGLEVYLDDYDKFLQVYYYIFQNLFNFSESEGLEMRKYIKIHLDLINDPIKRAITLLHKKGCNKIRDVFTFPLEQYVLFYIISLIKNIVIV